MMVLAIAIGQQAAENCGDNNTAVIFGSNTTASNNTAVGLTLY
jgi:hypothetical protein